MGTCEPSASDSPMAFHAPTERSSELAFPPQPGQLSAMMALIEIPLFKLVSETVCPQYDES